jgi:pilus assembly protein CpaB
MHDQTRSALQKLGELQNRASAILAQKGLLNRWGLVGILLAGTALWMLWPMRSDQEPSDSRPLLVSSEYIPPFSVLGASAVTLKNYPREWVPPGAFLSARELSGDNGQALYVSLVAIPAGQPLTRNVLSEISKNHALSGLLSPGQVAVSFAVNKISGVGGWIVPGDRIAVFQASHLLFPSVEVIAVGRNRLGIKPPKPSPDEETDSADPSESSASVLTILMNPLEAASFIETRDRGPLSVALRAIGDDFPWDTHGK